ncbi:UbiA family prenyltransferase [Halobacteriovorax sp. GB3]|uniref:UbiA family prenyltransferase n=1 Tax=Halobacteriovorax sp. GB3 TaxID=2719615 RepID=UPI002362E258|nr:UbiA family prenyltransferase [Halobacteriovorax sp. GB3]MDD0852506.1 UbiA family prenyltransferase [Halobacteriovorax sp. GB3]
MNSISKYISIARPDHWVKHIFIIPGIIISYSLSSEHSPNMVLNIILGFAAACCIASANYVINEWLDAEFDKYHPIKKDRTAVTEQLNKVIVYSEYFLLGIAGISIAYFINESFFFATIAFFLMGVLYNVRPFRTKEKMFLDVLSEAINNPIRLILGWTMVTSASLPPLSLILLYWLGGAFLMSLKRFSEYVHIKSIDSVENLHRYRKSFQSYTEEILLSSSVLYAIFSSFFIAIFLAKYKVEYILLLPALSLLFAYYFYLAMQKNAITQTPEKLFRDKILVILVIIISILFVLLSFVEIEIMEFLILSKEFSIGVLKEYIKRLF